MLEIRADAIERVLKYRKKMFLTLLENRPSFRVGVCLTTAAPAAKNDEEVFLKFKITGEETHSAEQNIISFFSFFVESRESEAFACVE